MLRFLCCSAALVGEVEMKLRCWHNGFCICYQSDILRLAGWSFDTFLWRWSLCVLRQIFLNLQRWLSSLTHHSFVWRGFDGFLRSERIVLATTSRWSRILSIASRQYGLIILRHLLLEAMQSCLLLLKCFLELAFPCRHIVYHRARTTPYRLSIWIKSGLRWCSIALSFAILLV